MAACKVCGAAIEWVSLITLGVPGRPSTHPIDVGVHEVPGVGAVALNRATGGAVVVAQRHERWLAEWADRGVEFRRSHFASCPGAQRVRDGALAGQEALF